MNGELATFGMLPARTNTDYIIWPKGNKASNYGITAKDENGAMSIFFKDNKRKRRRMFQRKRWLK